MLAKQNSYASSQFEIKYLIKNNREDSSKSWKELGKC